MQLIDEALVLLYEFDRLTTFVASPLVQLVRVRHSVREDMWRFYFEHYWN